MIGVRRVAAIVGYTARVAPFVSYLRVSTTRQGESGLGLEAQRQAVACHWDALWARAVCTECSRNGGKTKSIGRAGQ